MPTKRARGAPGKGLPFAEVIRLALQLPGVVESTSYGTAALKVRDKLLARLKEDNATIVLRVEHFEREHLLRCDPATFHITDHYRNYPYVLVNLTSADATLLAQLLEDAWRKAVTTAVRNEYDASK
ncbi:MAG: MmcQ/YjbR family DNA-binding protein [Gemmatimonadaceae bacterium]